MKIIEKWKRINWIFVKATSSYKSSHRRCSIRKGSLRNFGKFTGKHLYQDLFLNKVTGLSGNFIKEETQTKVFSCGFCEISENNLFTEHLWATVSAHSLQLYWNELLNNYLSNLLKLTMSSKIVMDGSFCRDGQFYMRCRYFVSTNLKKGSSSWRP